MLKRFSKTYNQILREITAVMAADDKVLREVIKTFIQKNLGNSKSAREVLKSINAAMVTRKDGLSEAQQKLAFKVLVEDHGYTLVHNFSHLVDVDVSSEDEDVVRELIMEGAVDLPESEMEDLPY